VSRQSWGLRNVFETWLLIWRESTLVHRQ
jgi:hypothetical protein